MKLQVKIIDDDGKVIAEHTTDACQPSRWMPPPGQKLQGKMPQISDNPNNGTYELFGITFQPHLRVDRPNGWQEPAPRPENGQPSFMKPMGKSALNFNKPTSGRVPGLRG